MTSKKKMGLPKLLAALSALFLLSTSGAFARPFFLQNGYAPYPQRTYAAPVYASPATGGAYYGASTSYGAALSRPSMPYYGASQAKDYLSSVCGEGMYTWQSDKFPIKIFISNGAGVPGYRPQFGDYIRHAFDTWCSISGGKLAWQEVKDPSQADVNVVWTNRVTERPEGTEAGKTDAYTRLNTATGKGIIYGARMQFLTQLPERAFSDEEVEKTTLHEAGHLFGLQGHSPYPNDIMYYAVGPRQQAVLTERDKNTMNLLYQSAPVLDAVALGKTASSPANR